MFFILKIFATIFILNVAVQAKIYERCELAQELLQRDIPKEDIPDWVCLAEFESTFNTQAINYVNSDNSWDWGIFQVNDRWWCDGNKETANVCQTSCSNFLTDDIGAILSCSLKIKEVHNFSAWVAWTNKCQGDVPSKQETLKCLS